MKTFLASPVARITSFFSSVRFRMSLWFAVVLAVVLLVFSAFVYYRIQQDVREQTAARLLGRLSEINTSMLRAYRSYERWGWWREPDAPDTLIFTLDDKEIVLVSDSQGKVAGAWGTITPEGTEKVSYKIGKLSTDRNTGRFFGLELTTSAAENAPDVSYLFSAAPVYYENRLLGWIVLGQPEDADGQLPRLRLTLAIAAAVTLLATLAGSYWLADRALWPIKAITRTAKEISATDLSRRLNIHTRDELGELAGTFDQMLDRLQSAFSRQRQFTADASHELRTPLTIIGLETTQALEGKRSPAEYQRALQVIRSENEFMTRLVGELLILARMDAGQVELRQEPLDLSDLAVEALERYAPLAAQKGIALQAGELPELPIYGDRQYLLQMIGNLIENAIKYSPPSSRQWARIETGAVEGSEPPGVWVRVSDNGPGIVPEHLPYLFDRFFRADRVRSHNPAEAGDDQEIPGSGLGLSIVQWIAQVHGGSVRVESEPGQGALFEVQLPAALAEMTSD